eukprot:3592262-Pyramimonas_sp.AAC.1
MSGFRQVSRPSLWNSTPAWGWEGADLDMLRCLGQRVDCIQSPWVIRADWDFTPFDVAASGWLDRVCGAIFPSGQPTCRSAAASGAGGAGGEDERPKDQ